MSQVFATKNAVLAMNRVGIGDGIRAGICDGMTAAWAETSLKYGKCSVAHQFSIQQSGLSAATRARLRRALGRTTVAAGEQWRNVMVACDLRPDWTTARSFDNYDALGQYITDSLQGRTIYFVVSVQNAAGAKEAHAMGARITAGECDFFEPNYGLERLASHAAFRDFVTARLNSMHPNVATSVVHVWTVTSV